MVRWLLASLFLVQTVEAQGIHNPSAQYLSFADSPFLSTSASSVYFQLENFEDGLVNTLGVTHVGGVVLLRNDNFSDSVDGDDGTIDNNGNTGGATTGAMYSNGLASLQFDFNVALLGGNLPTHVGLVMTDVFNNTTMTLSAYRAGNLVGSISGTQVPEFMHFTAQDRFYGFVDPIGLDRIVITAANDHDWALDHLQYGKAQVPGTTFCRGDGSAGSCPCSNNGAPGNGCANSFFAGGARMSGFGTPSVSTDSVLLTANYMTGSIAIFFQGAVQTTPTVIDDGLGCVGGPIIRLGNKPSNGASSYPQPGDPSVSVRGAVLPFQTFYYQCFYRNAAAAFCPPATSNRTNGLAITWTP